ncbi:MAG: hypothetical protein MZW92_41130 [Comamonadaceae bacterium]|nr:hypothetical protein [Comamonadaceae bacterium]
MPLRAAMWLWSVTWCAKWRVLSPRAGARRGADGEDWSARAQQRLGLVAHVRERVDCYLGVGAVERVRAETEELRREFG